jgi:hypothetical protein
MIADDLFRSAEAIGSYATKSKSWCRGGEPVQLLREGRNWRERHG